MKKKLNIGITYDLRSEYLAAGYTPEETAELDSEITVAAIERALTGAGHTVERIGGIKSLVPLLAAGKRWDIVFNIAEGIYGLSREAQVPALLDAYRIPYTFSEPAALCAALDKAAAKRIVRDCGHNTAGFCLVENAGDIERVNLPYPVFAKPVGEGSSKGIGHYSFIGSAEKLRETCLSLLEQFRQPVLVEEYLPGSEYTVGIIGTGDDARVIGVMEIALTAAAGEGYSYENKVNYLEKVSYRLADLTAAEECGELALKVWRALNCRDCGRVDIKYDKYDRPAFLEVNPLAGLNPEYSDLPIICGLLDIGYDDLIRAVVESASKRVP